MDETFLGRIIERLGRALSRNQRGACWTGRELVREIVKSRDDLAIPGTLSVPGKNVLAHLEQAGIVRQVQLEPGPSKSGSPPKLFLLGMDRDADSVHPVELLTALVPDGVLCHFTALWLHGLTTQPPPHHHVALVRSSSPSETSTGRVHPPSQDKSPEQRRPRDPLGTAKFSYHGLPYYLTRRGTHRLPGVQRRQLDERTIYRVTDREQSLLDAILHPLRSGGPSVVFEAWETAQDDLDEDHLVSLLQRINDPLLDIRVGYVLDTIEWNPGDELADRLDCARRTVRVGDVPLPLPLFRGYRFGRTEAHGVLEVP